MVIKADLASLVPARFCRHDRVTEERSVPVFRITSVIWFALFCASCSATPEKPESELSRKIVSVMEIYRETGGFDVSKELCGGFTREDLELSVRELENLGAKFYMINNDASGIRPDGTATAIFYHGAQFLYTQHLSIYVNEDVGYCEANNQIRFDFGF